MWLIVDDLTGTLVWVGMAVLFLVAGVLADSVFDKDTLTNGLVCLMLSSMAMLILTMLIHLTVWGMST